MASLYFPESHFITRPKLYLPWSTAGRPKKYHPTKYFEMPV
jgi:hypothetical protein